MSLTSFSMVICTSMILVGWPSFLEGIPRPQHDIQSVNNSIVFNVWEYARVVAGTLLPPKPSPNLLTTGQSVSSNSLDKNLPATATNTSSSSCAWAIASCCHATTDRRRNRCFDALGCGGAWFDNLCREGLLQEALSIISTEILH